MTINRKLIFACVLTIMLSSCAKDLEYFNRDPKNAETAPSGTLFTSAAKSLADNVVTPNVNVNIFRLIPQHWAQTTYPDESQFDIDTRPIPQNWWDAMYQDVIRDLAEAKKATAAESISDAQKANQTAQADILEVYAYSLLVNTFGDVPYSQALDINNVQPKYDNGREVYEAILTKLDAALAAIDEEEEGFAEADIIYGGDMAAWAKFGNSLKLRLGMTLADADATKARTVVEQAAQNVFESNDDNAVLQYLSAPPNTNPIWLNLVQSGRNDFVAGNTLVNQMNTLNDPRRQYYFTEFNGGYRGGIVGNPNDYDNFSHVAEPITDEAFPGVLMDYSEVRFYLAEATARGFNVGGTPAVHYSAAITASIEYWGGSSAAAATYLANPAVAYATAAGDYKQKIGTQKWIALYNRGFEAWMEWRRFDYPRLVRPTNALTAIPLRLTYPVIEQSLNGANYAQAAAAIGGDGDRVTTKLFWDRF